ncbi:MAG: hypothetical protein ACI318_04920 [Bacilli bacterium]|nr:hypothetical protein [Bacillales bacterium]MDY3889506.1 hypothetical protein [Bacilli bacterium]MDY6141808.1 hypothetical protein [Bacilli bacterium]
MAYNIKEITREKINELLIKGYLTFEVVYQINDEVKEKRDIMCKEDDIIFSNGTTIISLSEILPTSIKIEIFNQEFYSEEEIDDKISSHSMFDILPNGNNIKISFRYRKAKIN